MRNNAELQRDVLDELLWDPSINATNVQVAANDGGVTLNGSIGSYTEMHAAERDARRVRGVFSVVNHLEVRLPPAYEQTDADLVGAAKDALRWNTMVPGDRISVSSDYGRLTLRGEVPYQYQREAAYNAVRSLVGVKSVDDQITIAPSVSPGEVKTQIEKADAVVVGIDDRQKRIIRRECQRLGRGRPGEACGPLRPYWLLHEPHHSTYG